MPTSTKQRPSDSKPKNSSNQRIVKNPRAQLESAQLRTAANVAQSTSTGHGDGAAPHTANNKSQSWTNSLGQNEENANSTPSSSQAGGEGKKRSRLKKLSQKKIGLSIGLVASIAGFVASTFISPFASIIELKQVLSDDSLRYSGSAHGRRVNNVLGRYILSDSDGKFDGYGNSGILGKIKDMKSDKLVKEMADAGFEIKLKDPNNPGKGFQIRTLDGDAVDLGSGSLKAYSQFKDITDDVFDGKSFLTRARKARILYNRYRISRTNLLKLRLANKTDSAQKSLEQKFAQTFVDVDREELVLGVDPKEVAGGDDGAGAGVGAEQADGFNNGLEEFGDAVDRNAVKQAAEDALEGTAKNLDEVAADIGQGLGDAATSGSSLVGLFKGAAGGVASIPGVACEIKTYAAMFSTVIRAQRSVNLMRAAVTLASTIEALQTLQVEPGTYEELTALIRQLTKKNPETGRNAFSSAAYQNSVNGTNQAVHDLNLLRFGVSGAIGGSIQTWVERANSWPGLGEKTCSFATSLFGQGLATAAGLAINAVLGIGTPFTGGVSAGALIANVGISVAFAVGLEAIKYAGTAYLAPMLAGAEILGNEYGDGIATYLKTGLFSMNSRSAAMNGMGMLTVSQVSEWDNILHQELVAEQKERSLVARVFDPNNKSVMSALNTEIMAGIDLTDALGTITSIPATVVRSVTENSLKGLSKITGVKPRPTLALDPDDIARTETGVPIMGVPANHLVDEADDESPFGMTNVYKFMIDNKHVNDLGEPTSERYKEYYSRCNQVEDGDLAYTDGKLDTMCISSGDSTLRKFETFSAVFGENGVLADVLDSINGELGENVIGAAEGQSEPSTVKLEGLRGQDTSKDSCGTHKEKGVYKISNSNIQKKICIVNGVFEIDAPMANNLSAMLKHAKSDGVSLTHSSSFRLPSDQIRLRRKNCGTSQYQIYEMPSSQCSPPTAIPGRSNHEYGLAIDFRSGNQSMTKSLTGFQWLKANAANHGFYNLESEPWHWSFNGS